MLLYLLSFLSCSAAAPRLHEHLAILLLHAIPFPCVSDLAKFSLMELICGTFKAKDYGRGFKQ